jgi:hypothetical protein
MNDISKHFIFANSSLCRLAGRKSSPDWTSADFNQVLAIMSCVDSNGYRYHLT